MTATATPEEIHKFHLELGDVVITKDSESWADIAVPSLVEAAADDLICGYHLAILRPRKAAITGGYLFERCKASRLPTNFTSKRPGSRDMACRTPQ
jgi:type I restriction enzyme, S subunit